MSSGAQLEWQSKNPLSHGWLQQGWSSGQGGTGVPQQVPGLQAFRHPASSAGQTYRQQGSALGHGGKNGAPQHASYESQPSWQDCVPSLQV